MKRGQVTFFIIIGLVIVLIAGTVVYVAFIREPITPEGEEIPITRSELYAFMDSCFSEIVPEGLEIMRMVLTQSLRIF